MTNTEILWIINPEIVKNPVSLDSLYIFLKSKIFSNSVSAKPLNHSTNQPINHSTNQLICVFFKSLRLIYEFKNLNK